MNQTDVTDALAPDMDAQLEIGLVVCGVPPNLHEGLLRYLRDRIKPGHFLVACLENDFADACRRADPITGMRLPAIVLWLDGYAPAPSWGSPEAVAAWLSVLNPRDTRPTCEVCRVDGRTTVLHHGACWLHGTRERA